MNGEQFFRQEARICRDAASEASAAESRALLQLAKHYEKEAQAASSEPGRKPSQLSELNRH
jgi:hypothetical protein